MIKKVDHIGIAVSSLKEASTFYEKALGLKGSEIQEITSQQVRIVVFKVGEIHIELLEPINSDSPIAKFIAKRGEGLHHIAYITDNLEQQLKIVKNAGCQLIHETPVIGAHGKEIAFLHPKSTGGVLTELCKR